MTLAFAIPPCPDSTLQRLDPRWKLAALLLAAVCASAIAAPFIAALFLAGSFVLAALGRLQWGWYLRRIASLTLVLLIFVLLLPFLIADDGPTLPVGPLRLSWYGLKLAGLLLLKALTLVTLMLVLLATAPLDATLKAAHSLRVPGLLIQLVVLTYRYVFLLADEMARILIALRVRGYRLRPHRPRFRMLGLLTGTMLVRGYERAERVGQAMRCRGFDGRFRSLSEFRARWSDILAFFLVGACAGGLLAWDLSLRLL